MMTEGKVQELLVTLFAMFSSDTLFFLFRKRKIKKGRGSVEISLSSSISENWHYF